MRRALREEADFIARRHTPVPHEFVLDAIASLAPTTRPMFGCLAVYVEDRIVFILREKEVNPQDNGLWLATTKTHHASLRAQFPYLRSIESLGKGVTGWQIIATDTPDFERDALAASALVLAADPRIGKVLKRRLKSKSAKKPGAKRRHAAT